MQAGESTAVDEIGGSLSMATGYGRKMSSGAFSIRTADAGTAGVSGSLSLTIGKTSAGSSGDMILRTGCAAKGAGGSVSLVVGISGVTTGGRVTVSAGQSGYGINGGGNTGGTVSLVSG